MTDAEQREAARRFANKWKERGREDEDGRSYWIDFLSNVLGVDNVIDHVEFEKKVVVDGTTKRIDVYIPETHVLIEQKSLGKALDQKISHEMEVSIKAGDIVGLLYEAFLKQYKISDINPKEETAELKEKKEHKLKSLNALCVRIVFCLYAEDAGIFGKRNMFHDYLESYEVKDCRRALQ